MARLTIVETAALVGAAAERLTTLVADAMTERGTASLSLAGGNTPKALYDALADPSRPWRTRIDWSRLQLFWGDERCVPPDHPDSNFGMANHALLQHVPVAADHVHRIRAERPDRQAAADEYAHELPDRFDVMLLGLGEDCHIASIFPRSELLSASDELLSGSVGSLQTRPRVAAVFAPHLNAWRITVTPQVILDSRSIVMLVSGNKKAEAVAAAIDAPLDIVHRPGQLLRDAGDRVEWLLDQPAASNLV